MSINGNRILFDSINGLENPRRAKIVSALLVKKEKSSIAGGGIGPSSLMAVQSRDWEITPLDFEMDNVQTLLVTVSFQDRTYKSRSVISPAGLYAVSGLKLNDMYAEQSMVFTPIHVSFDNINSLKARTTDIFFSKG